MPVTDSKETIERIPVEKGGRKVLIPVDDIRFIMAKDDYSCIYTVDDRFLSTTSLAQFEAKLCDFGFFRVHRRYIVNLACVTDVETVPSGAIQLGITGVDERVPVSRRRVVPLKKASLMRPKAPRAGSRILLERIGFIWRRMGFLNKVAARNLFRYKKRAFMTIFGIAGCTALVICGMGIRDTSVALSPKQYGHITRYDLLAVANPDDFSQTCAALDERSAANDSNVTVTSTLPTSDLVQVSLDDLSLQKI